MAQWIRLSTSFGADNFIDTLALQSDGTMVIGGGFTHFDGQSRSHVARIYGGSLAGSGQFEFTSANFRADENSTNASLRSAGMEAPLGA